MWHLPGDDITTNGNYPFEVFVTLQPGVGELNTYFRTAYQLIARANVVIQKIGEENGVITTPGLKNAISARRISCAPMLISIYGTSMAPLPW
jgi:starch-binding outer membrane protein, SusD/RagB family